MNFTNTDRIRYGAKAVLAGNPDSIGSNDEQTNLTDTLANMMHYARENDLDFAQALRMAKAHFQDESKPTGTRP